MEHSFFCFTDKETEAHRRPPFSGLAGSPPFRIMILTGRKRAFAKQNILGERMHVPERACYVAQSVVSDTLQRCEL